MRALGRLHFLLARIALAIAASRQAQSQMITIVSGKPTLNAPPIINANAESKFASLRIALPDIIAAP